jgi:hypothetical protein
MMSVIKRVVWAGIFSVGMAAPVFAASLVVDGLNGAGSAQTDTLSSNSVTSLWSLVGNPGPLALASYPATDNTKNQILQYYVVATGSGGSSVFSLGELVGSGFGTSPVNVNVSSGGQVSLVDTAQSSRNVNNLTSLQVYTAPALFHGPEGVQSTSVAVSGGANPGTYNATQLQSFASSHGVTTTTVSGDTYTGVSLSTLLGLNSLSSSTVLNDIVITAGTDGYEVVLAAAELDTALGGNPNDILTYADTGSDFPTDGVARTIFPTDNKHGRFESNLDSIELVSATPLPSTWTMMLIGLSGLGFVSYGRKRKITLAAAV